MSQKRHELSLPNGDRISSTERAVTTRDWTGGITPSRCVVETVSDVTDADPWTITPLADALDPDALDTVFGAGDGQSERAGVDQVSFEYEGFGVTVYADERVVLWDLDDEAE